MEWVEYDYDELIWTNCLSEHEWMKKKHWVKREEKCEGKQSSKDVKEREQEPQNDGMHIQLALAQSLANRVRLFN